MVDGGILYLSRGYRSSPYMAIRLGGRGDITNTHVAWRVPTGGPYVSSLVHYQGIIYMSTDNGILSAVDAKNGERLWQERVGGTFSASPIAGDGKVYFVSEGGETIVIKAGRTFELHRAQQAEWPLRGLAGGRRRESVPARRRSVVRGRQIRIQEARCAASRRCSAVS